jgi:lysine 2,3-aminomutase
MAGTKTGDFVELISPFLRRKMTELELAHGMNSAAWRAIALQYVKNPVEAAISPQERRRHYESEITLQFNGQPLAGVERLYRRTALLEPTTVCAAHCRWCLRGQYPVNAERERDRQRGALFRRSRECSEVDGPHHQRRSADGTELLRIAFRRLPRAPASTIRIGTRVPFRTRPINDDLLSLLTSCPATASVRRQRQPPDRFWPESRAAIARLRATGATSITSIRCSGRERRPDGAGQLYALMRDTGIGRTICSMPSRWGMRHHHLGAEGCERRAPELPAVLGAPNRITLMTDIRQIVLYDSAHHRTPPSDNSLLLRSGYRLEDRKWNPSWRIPAGVQVDDKASCASGRTARTKPGASWVWDNLPLASSDTGRRRTRSRASGSAICGTGPRARLLQSQRRMRQADVVVEQRMVAISP